jgi:DNA-binding NarL/FixJ family response regulator
MTQPECPTKVLIADDQTLFRTGLGMLLASDKRIDVVGLAATGEEAVRLAAELRPQVVLMDLKMPQMDGLEATRQIVTRHPRVRVLVLTSYDAESHFIQALKAGARGYVLKDSDPEAIVSAILTVSSGESVMATPVAERVLQMLTGAVAPKDYYDGLTPREIEILRLVATGMANKQIAFRLKISEKTVRNHVSNTYEKLGIYDRSQAVLYAVRKGLIEP